MRCNYVKGAARAIAPSWQRPAATSQPPPAVAGAAIVCPPAGTLPALITSCSTLTRNLCRFADGHIFCGLSICLNIRFSCISSGSSH